MRNVEVVRADVTGSARRTVTEIPPCEEEIHDDICGGGGGRD